MGNGLTWIKCVFGALSAFISYIFGGVDVLLSALLFCIVADYITGILAAIYNKTLNSEVGYKGIIKKVGILIIVALANVISNATGADAIRALVIGFYIANEGISILENAGRMNIPYLKKLRIVLEQLKNNTDDN